MTGLGLRRALAVVALVAMCWAPVGGADEMDNDDFDVWYCLITGNCGWQVGGPGCQGGCMVCRWTLWNQYCDTAVNEWGGCTCSLTSVSGIVQCSLSGSACEGIVVTP